MKNKVTMNICGKDYTLSADEPPEYMLHVASLVDDRINQILQANPYFSTQMASVLAAVNICDEWQKAQKSADHLRGQIKQYLDDAAKSRAEADDARRETARLRAELQELRMRQSGGQNG